MTTVYIAWAVAAAVLSLVAIWLGLLTRGSAFGIFIDSRGRYSLSHFQLVLWTLLVLSLIVGFFCGRLLGGAEGEALDFTIPPEVLLLIGIGVGSTTLAKVIKTSKDTLGRRTWPRVVMRTHPASSRYSYWRRGRWPIRSLT
jgi:hypothetical protein